MPRLRPKPSTSASARDPPFFGKTRLSKSTSGRCVREFPTVTTDTDIAQLCLAIYSSSGAWDQLELPEDGIAFGVKDLGTVIALIFRGSTSLPDFIHHSEAIADPFEHDGLGPVHPGFFAGLPELWDRLKNTLTNKPCVVAGHSLGAARASLFTGLMVPADHSPVRRLCFGEPRSGFPQSDREQSATPSGVARARGGELRLCRRQEVRAYG